MDIKDTDVPDPGSHDNRYLQNQESEPLRDTQEWIYSHKDLQEGIDDTVWRLWPSMGRESILRRIIDKIKEVE